MMNWASESASSSSLRRQVSGQRWKSFIVARIVGELYGDGFGVALWDGSIQLLDCSLGLVTLIETNKADAFR